VTCQHFTNPFERFDNADLTILDQTTFSTRWTDTLDIFSNDTLFLAATVPELIDSYTVTVSHNRNFQKKIIIKPKAAACAFKISVYDTGNQTIAIDVYRRDGNTRSSNILFYTKNPLFQKDLLAEDLNDSLTLATIPVPDNNKVLYTWVLDHFIVRVPFTLVRTKASQMDKNEHTGHLFVSDSFYTSPQVTFKFSFKDNIPPSIICVDDGLNTVTKIVRTADSTFVFHVRVEDNEQYVEYVDFNGSQPEGTSNNVYSKVLKNAFTYTLEHPYQMIVTTMDNESFRNIAIDTFYIVYDASYVKKDTTIITLNKLNGDTLWTAANPVILNGSVINSNDKPVSLKASLNNLPLFDSPFPTGGGIWSHSCALAPANNSLSLKLFSENGVLLKERVLTIIYNNQIIDTVPPVLLSLSINNSESKLHYVNRDSAQLSFYAFDLESGIKSIIINKTDSLHISTGQYLWRKSIFDIKHEWESINIKITDIRNNTISDSVRICYNKLPSAMPSKLPYAIEINTEYSEELHLLDPDFDTLTVVPLHLPPDLVFSDDNRQFSWVPRIENAGKDSLVFQIYDQFQTSEPFTWRYNVFDPSITNTSINLASDQNIPKFLRAVQDSLVLSVTLGEPSGTPPYKYRIQLLTPGGILDSTSADGKITWTPAEEDTGECQIRLYVEDELEHSDTVISHVQIVPPNCDTAELVLENEAGAELIDSISLFLNVPDSSSVLTFKIRDDDHPLTEKYDVAIIMNGSTTTFTPAEKLFQVSILPPSFNNDTVIVTLKDNTRQQPDSMLFLIINPIANPNLISGLQRWYIPENFSTNFFSITWKDFFSADNDLSASEDVSAIKNSLNSHPTVKFNSSYLTDVDCGNWMATPFSIFMLAKYDSLPGSNQALISNFSQSTLSTFSFGLSSKGQVVAFNGPYMASPTVKTSLSTSGYIWYIYSFTSSGPDENQSMTVNIGVDREFEKITIVNLPDEAGMSIGTHNRTNKWAGDMAEILQYNRELSPIECKRVIGYLMKKYGLR
jgi:hypothetical protein